MKSIIDAWLAARLGAWVARVQDASGRALAAIGVATLALGTYAALGLGINSNNLDLISPELESRKNTAAFAELFPDLENALLVVIDGETPDLARDSAERLEARLNELPAHIVSAYQPGGGEFFERNGLLYRTPDELDDFAERIARVQPILAELERDPSLANLALLVREGLASAREDPSSADEWPAVLDRVGDATVDVYSEFPVAISWDEVLLRGSAVDPSKRRILVVHPILEFGSVLAAKRAIDSIREAAEILEIVPERGLRVRVTGNPALNLEEMIGIAWDVGVAGIFCFALVVGILTFALRSFPLVVGAVITLLVGLVWTAGFATLSVGHLNVVSFSFAILFIGSASISRSTCACATRTRCAPGTTSAARCRRQRATSAPPS